MIDVELPVSKEVLRVEILSGEKQVSPWLAIVSTANVPGPYDWLIEYDQPWITERWRLFGSDHVAQSSRNRGRSQAVAPGYGILSRILVRKREGSARPVHCSLFSVRVVVTIIHVPTSTRPDELEFPTDPITFV